MIRQLEIGVEIACFDALYLPGAVRVDGTPLKPLIDDAAEGPVLDDARHKASRIPPAIIRQPVDQRRRRCL